MRLARVLFLSSLAAGLFAQTPTWDTSGNGMLNGTYYFRHVTYVSRAIPVTAHSPMRPRSMAP